MTAPECGVTGADLSIVGVEWRPIAVDVGRIELLRDPTAKGLGCVIGECVLKAAPIFSRL
jgi:hypothetical protein